MIARGAPLDAGAGEALARARRTGSAALSATIRALFDGDVAAAELCGTADPADLHPEEVAAAAAFAPKRLAEFRAGRACAHRALAEYGLGSVGVTVNADRTPRWPDGVVGSITHTGSFAAAVVADTRRVRALGLDAERIGRVRPELDRLVFTPAEAAFLASLDDDQRRRIATIAFSAKEAFFKCQYTLTHAWRHFTDVTIAFTGDDRDAGRFTVAPSPTAIVSDWVVALPLHGRFTIDNGIAITGLAAYRTDDDESASQRAVRTKFGVLAEVVAGLRA